MADAHRVRTLILGAAGRDFHNFNMLYRDDPATEVIAFTATQIPGIAGRRYPSSLAGRFYPQGIAVRAETELEEICRSACIERVLFAYSDVDHAQVMHLAARALSSGADFTLVGPDRTMLRSEKPVIAVSAVRTGCGKSQTARFVSRRLRTLGHRVAVIRHPMPYGDFERQRVQRFARPADLTQAEATIEEREEYEPHIAAGNVVFAGVDYGAILTHAERECDVILWDGGNNDFPFVRPNLHIVIVDALRPDQVDTHHPGETVARMADLFVINKVNNASPASIARATAAIRALNPEAPIVRAASPVILDDPGAVRGRRVVIVEDGPTITHGGMAGGAGFFAVGEIADAQIVDPRPFAKGALSEAYAHYPHIGPVVPALGYGRDQLDALEQTLTAVAADVIVAATPVDLAALIAPGKPIVRARYDYADAGEPTLGDFIDRFAATLAGRPRC